MTAEYSRTTPSWTITSESANLTEFLNTSGSPTGVGFSDQETVPLWLPYVVLTSFLLILVVISFVRFHLERTAQNRQRLEAIADQLEKDRQAAGMSAARRRGRRAGECEICDVHQAASEFSVPLSAITTPSSSYVPAYLDLFLSFSGTTTVRIRAYAMFFVVLLLFLILVCFYYVYCTLLSLSIVLLHVCT